jgi:hypothetical protein
LTRIHGRSGVAYLSRLSGDPASPVAFISDWTVEFTRVVSDVTSVVDTQHVWTAAITGVTGSFTGFFDTATAQSYSAAVDGLPRNLFLYPDLTDTVRFFTGPVLPDYAVGGGATSAVSLAVSWTATGPFTRSGLGAVAARLARAAGTAQQPSVPVSGNVTAAAGLAAAAGAAQQPSAAVPGAVTAAAGLATAAGTARQPSAATSGTVTATARLATADGTAQSAVTGTGTGFLSVPGLAVPGHFTPGDPGLPAARTAVYSAAYTAVY